MQYLRTRLKTNGEMVVETTSAAHAGEFVVDSTLNNIQLPYGLVADLTFANLAEFRSQTSIPDGTYFKIVSPLGEYLYVTGSGANWAADDNTILKLDSVASSSNGRAFSTKASEHANTFAAARAMKGLLGKTKFLNIESHTKFGDGGGGIFDIKDNIASTYTSDDNGTQLLIGTPGTTGSYALIRQNRFATAVNPKWWGAAGDLTFTTSGSYIVTSSISGGENDEVAILAARDFAVANKKPMHIPAGTYLFHTNQFHFARGLIVTGEFGLTNIVSRINKPFVIGTMTSFCFEVTIKDITLLCYENHSSDPEDWVALDLYATTFSNISFAARGWDVNCKSVHESIDPYTDIRGENYQTHFKFRQMGYSTWLPIPKPSGIICHIEGQVNGSTFSCDTANPVTSSLILKGGLRGNLGSTITIDYVQSDTCANAVVIEDGGGISIKHLYAEGCVNSLALTNCTLVDITNVRGGDVVVTDCKGVSIGESVARLVNVRSQVFNKGTAFGQAPKSVLSSNVGIMSFGHNFEPGIDNRHPTCNHSQLDSRNLFLNGDFSRWIGNVPWLWRNTPGYSPIFTKCGVGLANTTHSAAVPYCCKVFGTTIGEFYVTPPLGDQYLGTTVALSMKVKLDGGYAGLTIKGNNPSLTNISGSRAVNETSVWTECIDEASGTNWRLITFMWLIDQDICDNGIALQMQTNAACDIYLSELQINFGIAVPRGYIHAREILGGNVGIKRTGNIELESSTLPLITTDPIVSQTLLAGDRANDLSGATGGWRYNGSTWTPVLEDDASIFKARLISATNGKLIRAVLGDDLPNSGTINSLPAFVGSACPAATTGRATLGTLRGRKAALFSSSSLGQGYTFEGAMPEYWCVARWDDTLPFPYFNSMLGGQTTAGVGQRLIGASGSSAILSTVGTIEKNGILTQSIETGISAVWRVFGVSGSDGRQIGCGDSGASLNWRGPIALALAFNPQLSVEESSTVLSLIKNYYNI